MGVRRQWQAVGTPDRTCVAAVHQPNYIPWAGYFHKMAVADVFVLLDDVVYNRKGFTNRNRIRTPEGWTWLTVPVHASDDSLIREVTIANEHGWRHKHWKTLQTYYNNAPHFEAHRDALAAIYDREWERLADLNAALIEHVHGALGLDTEMVWSSDLDAGGTKTGRNLALCRSAGGDVYLSGASGRDYLDRGLFAEAGVGLAFQRFEHPRYDQVYDGFEPNMSFLDMLFNVGPKTLDVLMDGNLDREGVLAAAGSEDAP